MAANVWKNSLKNAESDNNKILYESLLDFFLQRNCTYFLNKPRTFQQGSVARACVRARGSGSPLMANIMCLQPPARQVVLIGLRRYV